MLQRTLCTLAGVSAATAAAPPVAGAAAMPALGHCVAAANNHNTEYTVGGPALNTQLAAVVHLVLI